MNCTWIIKAPNAFLIQLNWIAFETDRICSDYVEIFDSDKKIAKYCGTQLPPSILSVTNVIIIKFVTDNENHYKGFKLDFVFLDETKG